MPDPGLTRPDLCSIPAADADAEPAGAIRGGAQRRRPPAAPAMTRPHPRRAASTAPSACPPRRPCSPWRASRRMSPTGTPTRSSGPTARPGSPPGSSPPRSTAWSTPVRWWCCTAGTGRRYPPWPAGCSRWESPLPSPRTWPRAGPTVPSGRWLGLAGGQPRGLGELLVWLIRTSGAADLGPSAARPINSAACRAAARPVPASAADGERLAGSERGTPGPAWRPAGQAAGLSPIPAGGQRDDEVLEASAVNDAAVAAYRLSVRPAIRSRRTRARPDVRTHIPPLGASQNGPAPTASPVPRLAVTRTTAGWQPA